jgi:hypothetical protein
VHDYRLLVPASEFAARYTLAALEQDPPTAIV